MDWKSISYEKLNGRAQENFNFAKLASRLADWGWHCLRLTDDWGGADLIAVHIDKSRAPLKIQLKGRLSFFKRYFDSGLHVAFPYEGEWYLYDHDALFELFRAKIEQTESWKKDDGGYTFPGLSFENRTIMKSWQIPHPPAPPQS